MPLEHADLRRREPDAARVVHQVRHLLGQAREVVVELLHLAGAHPQHRVRVLADLRERDASARAILRVELPLVDLVPALWCRRDTAVRHARECSQTVWGSTSTTALTPARRIAGAAAASTRPAAAASARGRSVFATSWERCRPRRRSSGAGPSRSAPFSSPFSSRSSRSGASGVRARGDDRDQVPERRVAELAAPVELLREEACDVVAGRVAERRRVRLERLHDHLPRRVAAAATRELRHELERPLLRAEVREREPRVRVDDGGERDPGEVMALRDHLRADEDGAVGGGEAVERLAERPGLRGRVRIEPDPLELRHPLLELGLEPLRAGADPRQLGRAARRARLRDRLRVAAMVAVQPRVPVQRQRDVAEPAAPRDARRRGSGWRAPGLGG